MMRAGPPEPKRDERSVELTVERIGAQGDGVAQYRGELVYLPFAVTGDRVLARLGARRGGGREGRVVERLSFGPGRADPQCVHFGTCGGCALQHLQPELYQAVKLERLRSALVRVGIDPALVGPLETPSPVRRRARLGIVRPRDPLLPVRVGYRERFRHNLIDLQECPVLEPALFRVSLALRRIARDLVAPGGSAEAILTRTDSGIDLIIEKVEEPGLIACEVLAKFAAECDLARVSWRSGTHEIVVVERRPVRVILSGVAVSYPPGAFLQASRSAETLLVREVLGGVGSGGPALDLFAGLGTFTFALAHDRPVRAVEGDKRMAAALALATTARPDITVECRDLAYNPLPGDALAGFAAAVFDPPRAGAARQAQALAASALQRIVAISCNPATFARDAAILVGGGYRIDCITPIDQFMWTPHLEIAATFRR
jgi:23S rRNA (uracil1939-C5)-methyltransferase